MGTPQVDEVDKVDEVGKVDKDMVGF